MIKPPVGALMMSTSAVVLGLVVAIEASMAAFSTVQAGISAETPVAGITLGLVVIGGFAALVGAAKGAHSLVVFTLACGRWIQTMNATVERVEAHQKEIAALQRWRDAIVDPLCERLAVGKANPVTLNDLYRDEAAG